MVISLDYPDSVSCQHFIAPQLHLVDLCSADLATRAALPQNRVETLNPACTGYVSSEYYIGDGVTGL